MKGITSPEGIIMLIVAVTLDLIGFIIFCLGTWFGIDDYGILEMIGIVIFGLWMYSRYGLMGGDQFSKVAAERKKMERGEDYLQEWMEKEDTKEAALDGRTQKKGGGKPETGSAPGKEGAPTKGDKGPPLLSTKPTGRGWQSPKDIVKDEAWKLTKKALKRFGLTFLVELLPFLGGFYPGWTIFVWKEMKD